MAGEAQDTQTADDAGHDDAFDAGFGNQVQQTITPADTQVQEPAADNAAPADPVEPPPEYVQVTKAEWEDMRQKLTAIDQIKADNKTRFDSIGGHIGGLKQTLDAIKAANQAGQPVEISDEDFAELREEYPDLAALVVKGQQRVLGRARGGAPQDSAAIEKLVNERIGSLREQQIDVSLDAVVDGDWKAEVKSEQFDTWFKAQSDDIKGLMQSDNFRDAARMLRLFKASKSAPAPAVPAAPEPAPVSNRRRQLSAAVNPRGVPALPQATTDDDEFDKAFNSR